MYDSEQFENPDTLVTCPYDPAHKISKCDIARHLVKCKKQNPEIAKARVTCPFNSTHILLPSELEYHETICSDRGLFYMHTHKTEDSQNPVIEDLYHNTMIKVDIPCEENWDDEIRDGVSIIEKCQKDAEERCVLQSNSNKPRAERKKLGLEQRTKMREKMNADEEKKRNFSDRSFRK